MSKLMEGKKGLILGLSNERGIAYGISNKLFQNGAKLGFNYNIDAMKKRAEPLAEKLGADFFIKADVTNDEEMDYLFKEIENKWGKLDFVVHAVAFSDKSELAKPFMYTSRENFKMTMDISCYSFIDVCKRAAPLMKDGGSCLAMTYFGGEKVILNYNVMAVAKAALDCSVKYLAADLGPKNIRVNAISAGPIKTLAAAGIGDFRFMLKWNEKNTPMRDNVTTDQVGDSAVYMLSDLSSAVTGEIHHVDNGYNINGMLSSNVAEKLLKSDMLDDVE